MVRAWPGTIVAAVLFCFVLVSANQGLAATFQVNTEVDVDPPEACDPSPGTCSLREAIVAANTHPGGDSIEVPEGTYQLAIVGRSEDQAATGDLDITDDLVIVGAGSTTTIVDGSGIDRVFQVLSGVTVRVVHLTVRGGGSGDENGGGIHNLGSLMMEDCEVTDNTANDAAGGIYNGGSLELDRCIVSRNSASSGGGVLSTFATLTLHETTVSDNSAAFVGGGVFKNLGAMTLTSSTISDNYAGETGGGVYTNGSDAVINNCTISGNQVEYSYGQAGGIISWGDLRLTNCVLKGNTSLGIPPGGIFHGGDTLTLENTLFDGDCLIAGATVLSGGGNLESPGNTCGLTDPTDQVNISDPMLGPLLDNGGLTSTHALLNGSPAIDHALNQSCPTLDQRGFLRWDGSCDVGAYEAGAVDFAIFTDGFETGTTSHWS